ncbi:MAG: hypothetical protein IPJ65_31190 [Archangiaceae bacterium]|nr:hypothetical protein [Archangiaceae bacterium]
MLAPLLLAALLAPDDYSGSAEGGAPPAPVAEVTAPDLAAPEREPRLAVGFYPQAMTVPLAMVVGIQTLAFHLPVSVTYAMSPSTALYAEAAGTLLYGPFGVAGTFGISFGAQFSIGPASSPLHGFFVCPRAGFQLSNARAHFLLGKGASNGPIDLGPAWSRAFLAGADVGYQWTWGSRHIAVMLGGSFGYAFDNFGPWVEPLGLSRGAAMGGAPTPRPRNQGFAFAINGNLFRIGFAL